MSQRVRKAVIPVAGLGTRFLPATKAMPKEMLTVVDRPVVQYAVDEAFEAGIEHVVFVTGRGKGLIEDHFDFQFELDATLRERGKEEALAQLERDQPDAGQISFTRQQKPLGLGHAVWCARDIVGDEPFAVLLPDMVMDGKPGCLKQMMDAYEAVGGNIIAVQETTPDMAHNYGIVATGAEKGAAFEITDMVEKPAPGTAPSNLYINGRYILQPRIMDLLANQSTGAGGEIQLTDAMLGMMKTDPFFGVAFTGRTFDCGSKAGFLEANVMLALKSDETRQELAELVRSLDL
ncbi:UTP--glucose-1-phosphate uridylyltransferase GalU [Oricola cellulosilytica]|uniref:UTP--glucose-1-phosphate uridylyltransferase n=1 Tax=Oricola cellulosilytica TaxID=1429082 RepID=A0A4R0PCM5_9HYPH|nr:UTP--glucose-1-phosphate uridylyltransferase GalU [Oricola cellulosilytica]TCD14049.1 UTP--glucose-1-phosphate uridylyltransferase GalU [Oricola cellulosilytica]